MGYPSNPSKIWPGVTRLIIKQNDRPPLSLFYLVFLYYFFTFLIPIIMSQTISNSEIERVRNDTFRPQLPLKHGSRKLGEWNIFVFYASLQADDAHPEYEVAKRSLYYI